MENNQETNPLQSDEYDDDFEKPETKEISIQASPRQENPNPNPNPNLKPKRNVPSKNTDEEYEPDFQDSPNVETINENTQTKKDGVNNLSDSSLRVNVKEGFGNNMDDNNNGNKGSLLINSHNSHNNNNNKATADIPTNPNREKMIEQNIKLKTQIYELAKQMDEIMAKEKKHKKYGIHAYEQEDDELLKIKKHELKKQQVEILNLKNKIFITKRQLEHVYDSRGIQGKEDELKNLQKELKELQDEKNALNKVKKEQSKALKIIRNDHEYENKISSLKENIAKMKEECRYLSENLVENERILRKNHETYLTKQAKIKEMEQKIKESKDKTKASKASKSKSKNGATITSSNVQQNVTPEMVTELEKEIQLIEEQRKEAEKSWNEKISAIEQELQTKRLEEEKKLLILKEREKELRLSELRVKELKKLIQHHQKEITKSRQTEQKEEAKEIDSREFRHKRNIKHL